MILGLDISTTMVGVAVVDPQTRKLVSSREWDISKYDSLYEKAELIGAERYALRSEYNIEDVFIERSEIRPICDGFYVLMKPGIEFAFLPEVCPP